MTQKKKIQGFPSCFLETLKTWSWKEYKHIQLTISGYLESTVHGPSYYTGSKAFKCSPSQGSWRRCPPGVSSCIPAEAIAAAQHHLMGDIPYDTWPQALCSCAALLLGRTWKKSPLAQKLNNCSQRRKNGCGGNWSPREPQKDGVHLKRWQENN